jgi:hypothetical protein
MKHDDIRHMLSEYIDGAVTRKEKTAIENHLKSCTECRNALVELKKTIEHIKKVEEVNSPAWMTQKIMAKVRAEAEQKRSFFQRLFYPLAIKLPIQAVAVLFLAVTAFYIYQNMNPMEKYAEAPAFIEANKEPPATGLAMNEQKMKRDSSLATKKAPQAPGYKSLDMKYMYEKPAVAPVESKPSSASAKKTAEQPASEKSSPDKMERFADASRQVAPAEERGLIEEKEFVARAKKPAAASPYAGAVAKDEAQAPAPEAKSLALVGKQEAGIYLNVTVKDIDIAGKEVEKAVARLNGKIIKTESLKNGRVFIVKLSSSKFKELVEKLQQVGEIKEKGLPSPAQAGDVDIKVELFGSQMRK